MGEYGFATCYRKARSCSPSQALTRGLSGALRRDSHGTRGGGTRPARELRPPSAAQVSAPHSLDTGRWHPSEWLLAAAGLFIQRTGGGGALPLPLRALLSPLLATEALLRTLAKRSETRSFEGQGGGFPW